jgi:negative regulator of sigma E activity
MEQDTDALIQLELDGANTADASSRLKNLMKADAGLQARFDEFALLTAAISKMPRAQPSADFTSNVMAALPAVSRSRVTAPSRAAAPGRALAARGSGFLHSLFAPRMQLVYASVAGALIATAVTLSMGSVPIESASATLSSGTPQAFATVEVGGVVVAAFQDGDSLILAIDGDADVLFTWDAAVYGDIGVSWSGSVGSAQTAPGQLTVLNSGPGEARVSLQPASGSPIEISVGDAVETIQPPVQN